MTLKTDVTYVILKMLGLFKTDLLLVMEVMGFELGLKDRVRTVRNSGYSCGQWKVQTWDGA